MHNNQNWKIVQLYDSDKYGLQHKAVVPYGGCKRICIWERFIEAQNTRCANKDLQLLLYFKHLEAILDFEVMVGKKT